MSDSNPPLETVIQEHLDAAFGPKTVRLPGVVVRQDPETLRVTVRPAVNARNKDADTDQLTPLPLPLVQDAPVAYPQGKAPDGSVVQIVWPLQPGTSVWLCPADRSIDEWRDGADAPVTPASIRRFSLTDAVAVPMASRDTEAVSSATAAAVVAGALVVNALDIRLGGPAATAVALAALVDARFAAIESFLATHVHTGVTTGSGASGIAAGAPSGTSTAATATKAV